MSEYIQDEVSKNDFEKLLEQEDGLSRLENEANVHNGDLIEGTVIKVTNEDVFLDIGLKTEGVISINEFDGKEYPKEGDSIKAVVSKRTSESVLLSFSKAKNLNSLESLQTAFDNKLTINAKIIESVKGGLIAIIDKTTRAFVPISQIDVVHVNDETSKTYIGKSFDFKITQLDIKKNYTNVVLSRKRLLHDEENEKKNKFFQEKKEGDIVKGIVKNYASFGVFIDLGGFDGLLHMSDLSWGRNVKPTEVAPKNQELSLMITKLDHENKKINLSLKAMHPNPWDSIDDKYQEGDTVKGEIVKILPYGAFVHIDDEIEGFVHISDMSWVKRIVHPNDILKVHAMVECRVLSIDKAQQRISLGIKQLEENPWDKIETSHPVGLKISVHVAKVLKAGAIVELENGIKGFISRDDFSWNKKNEPRLEENSTLECRVLGHDQKLREVKLGLKQLEENPWDKEGLKVGTIVEGTISNIADFGIFLKISEDIEGLIPKSQAYDPTEISSYEEAKHSFKKGNKIQAVVQHINLDTHRLSLSVRELKEVATKQELEKHLYAEDTSHNVNLGDILAQNDNKFNG